MRLLHTKTYRLHSITDVPPPYAILSHTWGNEEVSFKDTSNYASTRTKEGWRKIFSSCRRASDDGWEYIWIDTCCIDKTDTTELGEAINSMFRWYEEAQICYAYLADVPELYFSSSQESSKIPWKWHFRSSRWFTRGWTLQELLAPTFLLFIDRSWGNIGSREEWAEEIYSTTGIEEKQLRDFRSCSLATKLSWASNRHTTREEDRAYSLLGVLGVNMPLIYGEGRRAFIRLQHELIKQYSDETIFAWGVNPGSGYVLAMGYCISECCILVTSPEEFTHSNGLITWAFDKDRRGFAITNVGLSINTELFEFPKRLPDGESIFAIQLNCSRGWPPLDATKSPLVLFLQIMHAKHDFSNKQPVFCKKISTLLRNWHELISCEYRSWGRQDILITEGKETEPIAQIGSSDTLVTFDQTQEISLLVFNRFYQTSPAFGQRWNFDCTLNSHARNPRGFEIIVSRYQAVVGEILVRTPTRWSTLGIIIKWAPRSLSFGVRESGAYNVPIWKDTLKYLDFDRERPYPSSVVLSNLSENFVVRVATIPKPVPVSQAQRHACFTITVRDLGKRLEDNPDCLKPVIYSGRTSI
ncbi:hypothetical protein G7Y89_g9061 [Cudoniella acicularis]|uniref:Heterokaryon incompatibility domain-containing protein n=1 Tax=Cudoniella acicularis TaxID=354080 RepID=A0A8H4RI16_9HELO|nr:hypothetical protein G7Y89_g9061 [Cudoniella acicularis]